MGAAFRSLVLCQLDHINLFDTKLLVIVKKSFPKHLSADIVLLHLPTNMPAQFLYKLNPLLIGNLIFKAVRTTTWFIWILLLRQSCHCALFSFEIFIASIVANAAESDKRDLKSELELMKTLKPHPYVIKLLGCVTESGTNSIFLRGPFYPHNYSPFYVSKANGFELTRLYYLFTNSCNHISSNGKALLHSHINPNNPQFLYSL